MSSALAGKRIVLGVTGGIAAYKAIEVSRRLVDAGAHVVPIMTAGAERFIGRTTLSALASEPVQTELWNNPTTPIPHTKIGQGADLVLVAPATARIIAAYRMGLSTDLLTNTLIATRAPVVICPRCTPRCGSTPRSPTTSRCSASAACTSSSPPSGASPVAMSAQDASPIRS